MGQVQQVQAFKPQIFSTHIKSATHSLSTVSQQLEVLRAPLKDQNLRAQDIANFLKNKPLSTSEQKEVQAFFKRYGHLGQRVSDLLNENQRILTSEAKINVSLDELKKAQIQHDSAPKKPILNLAEERKAAQKGWTHLLTPQSDNKPVSKTPVYEPKQVLIKEAKHSPVSTVRTQEAPKQQVQQTLTQPKSELKRPVQEAKHQALRVETTKVDRTSVGSISMANKCAFQAVDPKVTVSEISAFVAAVKEDHSQFPDISDPKIKNPAINRKYPLTGPNELSDILSGRQNVDQVLFDFAKFKGFGTVVVEDGTGEAKKIHGQNSYTYEIDKDGPTLQVSYSPGHWTHRGVK